MVSANPHDGEPLPLPLVGEPLPLPLVPYDADDGVTDPGAVRNTVVQLVAQVVTFVFTAGLTFYLVRALGPSSYGVYSLAVSIGALAVFPALAGMPLAVGRYIADHRASRQRVRHIYRLGLKLQIPAATIVSLALFAAAGPIAHAYGSPDLVWPLRWIALSVGGQAMYGFLTAVGTSIRRSSVPLWMTIWESLTEPATSIALVVGGAGAAGAALGKLVGYIVATAAGMYLVWRVLGQRTPARRPPTSPVTARALLGYAGVMFVVDITWSAIAQIDVLLIGALLGVTAVGPFSAVLRILLVLAYLGTAVSGGVAPRLSMTGAGPDVESFARALRYLLILQGVTIAPLIVWAEPITHLLLGAGYGSAASIMRVLTPYSFFGAPASIITLAVTYLGEARRRLVVMLGTLALGLVLTYVLIKVIGILGAAIADDVVILIYVGAHFWICAQLIALPVRRLIQSLCSTIAAAAAMAAILFAAGTHDLSPAEWILGGIGGLAAYAAVMLATAELSIAELRQLGSRVRARR
jgi:O-antigen/teichoic acid export membrane protein